MAVSTRPAVNGVPASIMYVGIHSSGSANWTSATSPNSERAYSNANPRSDRKLDLRSFTQARLVVYVTEANTSVNSPRLYVTYGTDGTTFGAVIAASGTPNCSVSATGYVDTAWFDIADGARIDNCYVRLAENGGDATDSHTIAFAEILFR